MINKWTWVFTAIYCVVGGLADFGKINNVIKAINNCQPSEVEFCMSKWVFSSLRDISNKPKLSFLDGLVELKRNSNQTGNTTSESNDEVFTGRYSKEDGDNVEQMIIDSIFDFIQTHKVELKFPNEGRGQGIMRTYRRFRRFFLPLLIGSKLKLAAFLPFALSILAILAKGAFLSGNAALFLSGLTIFLRYFYPKSTDYGYVYKHEPTGYDSGHSNAVEGDYSHGHYHQHYHNPHSHPHTHSGHDHYHHH